MSFMSESVRFLTITPDETGQRLDNYLSRILKGAPKSLIYRIIRKGEVRVNKGRAKPERKLQAGDIVRVPPVRLNEQTPSPRPGDQLKALLQSSILFENSGLLIVNKPSGLAVHGGSGINLGLVEALRQIRDDDYLELVHRLDRDTSGCIILAKKRSMLRQLHSRLREQGGIEKNYLALVQGHWSKRKSIIDVPLKKNELKSGERIVRVDMEGKPSKTVFDVVSYYQDCTLVKAKPITGRTHQIRVHAQYAKHPLVGDEKYGTDEFNKLMKSRGFRRLFLHASSLQFSLENGESIDVSAPLPEELEKALRALPKR